METSNTTQSTMQDVFSQDISGLSSAVATQTVEVTDGGVYELQAAPVRKRLGSEEVRQVAYNGSVPGPTLRVRQGATVAVNFTNQSDLESTVHWHGLRLENPYDGTHLTQTPVPVGGNFTYRVQCPDPGIYWYHPHIREDYAQEMGLYGNVLVMPTEPDYWPPAHREVVLALDDILLENGKVAPFNRSEPTHTAMGRFGNVFLVNGEPQLLLTAQLGEVVRFYLTNTANTRIFNVRLQGARMKLVGGDSGRCEREEFVETVLLAPSERLVIDVLFDKPGPVTLEHVTPEGSTALAAITVSQNPALPSLAQQFEILRSNSELVSERERLAPYLTAGPDKTLAFGAVMDIGAPEAADAGVVYTCPMHPEVVSNEPGSCPTCGMNLLPKAAPESVKAYTCPMHPEVISNEPGSCPKCGMKLLVKAASEPVTSYSCPMHPEVVSDKAGRCPMCGMNLVPSHGAGRSGHGSGQSQMPVHDPSMSGHETHNPPNQHDGGHQEHQGHDQATAGIEWEDDMVEVNRMTTPANMQWKVIDRSTGAENQAIDWQFRVGERVKIRLVNEMDSDHPMHHPFHIHGAGRFLVLARDRTVEPNLMWKDTVLVQTGQTVDILLDITNPGVWMAHCHIAEHHESGMMFTFRVHQ